MNIAAIASDQKFASPQDQQAWERDLFVFGHALLDEDGKHVPLDTVLIKGTQISVQLANVIGTSPCMDALGITNPNDDERD